MKYVCHLCWCLCCQLGAQELEPELRSCLESYLGLRLAEEVQDYRRELGKVAVRTLLNLAPAMRDCVVKTEMSVALIGRQSVRQLNECRRAVPNTEKVWMKYMGGEK